MSHNHPAVTWIILVFGIIWSSQCLSQSAYENQDLSTDSLIALSDSLYRSQPQLAISLTEKVIAKAKSKTDNRSFPRALALKGIALTYADLYDSAFHYLNLADSILETQSGQAEWSVKTANMLGMTYQRSGRYGLAIDQFRRAARCADSLNLLKEFAAANNNLGNTYMFKGQHRLANQFLEKSLETRRQIKSADTASSFMNLAIIKMQLGNYPESLELFLESLGIFETKNDSFNVAQVHSNLGNLYKNMYDYDKAEHSFQMALGYYQRNGLQLVQSKTHNNLGLLYFLQDKTDDAFFHFNQSLQIIERIDSNQDLWAPLLNLGYYHYEAGNYEQAEGFLLRAYSESQKMESTEGMCLSKIHLALVYKNTGDLDSAERNALTSVELAENGCPLSTQEYILHSTHSIYEVRNDQAKALDYYKKYIAIRDSARNERVQNQIAELNAIHELKQKEQEISVLNSRATQLQLEAELAGSRTSVLWVSLALVLSVGSLLAFLLRARLRIQKANNETLKAQASNFAKQVTLKSELLDELKQEIGKLRKADSKNRKSQFYNIVNLLETSISSDDDWQAFAKKIEQVDPDFFTRLEKEYPELTNNELRLTALIRLRLTNKEIANITHVEPNSVKQSKYRLKKKLGLSSKEDLGKFLYDF